MHNCSRAAVSGAGQAWCVSYWVFRLGMLLPVAGVLGDRSEVRPWGGAWIARKTRDNVVKVCRVNKLTCQRDKATLNPTFAPTSARVRVQFNWR